MTFTSVSAAPDQWETAQITATSLNFGDRGILVAGLVLEADGWGVSWPGGFVLDTPLSVDGKFIRRVGHGIGSEFIATLLATLEVESWEKLPGTYVRYERGSWGERSDGKTIGHIIKDRWLNTTDLVARYEGDAAAVESGAA